MEPMMDYVMERDLPPPLPEHPGYHQAQHQQPQQLPPYYPYNSTPQCPYMQSHHNTAAPPRDFSRYDPVRSNDGWPSMSVRSPYPPLSNHNADMASWHNHGPGGWITMTQDPPQQYPPQQQQRQRTSEPPAIRSTLNNHPPWGDMHSHAFTYGYFNPPPHFMPQYGYARHEGSGSSTYGSGPVRNPVGGSSTNPALRSPFSISLGRTISPQDPGSFQQVNDSNDEPPSATPSRGYEHRGAQPASENLFENHRQAHSRSTGIFPSARDFSLNGRRLSFSSDADSIEDLEDAFDEYSPQSRSAITIMRGSAYKRVTSQLAISRLEKVVTKELDKGDRCCTICYNEFEVENPEGVAEEPLRLPNCKHVFGDKCIRKWLEDSDTCPYCRDKLPSDLRRLPSSNSLARYDQSSTRAFRLGSNTQTIHDLAAVDPSDSFRGSNLATRTSGTNEPSAQQISDRSVPYLSSTRQINTDLSDSRRRRRSMGAGRALPHPLRHNYSTPRGLFPTVNQQTSAGVPLAQAASPEGHNLFGFDVSRTSNVQNRGENVAPTSSFPGDSPPVVSGSSLITRRGRMGIGRPGLERENSSQWHDSAMEFLHRDEQNSQVSSHGLRPSEADENVSEHGSSADSSGASESVNPPSSRAEDDFGDSAWGQSNSVASQNPSVRELYGQI